MSNSDKHEAAADPKAKSAELSDADLEKVSGGAASTQVTSQITGVAKADIFGGGGGSGRSDIYGGGGGSGRS